MLEIAVPDLASPAFKANPHPFYALLREESPVWRTTLPDKRTTWLVTRYEDVAEVLKDDNFAKDPLNAQDPGAAGQGAWVPGSSSRWRATCSTSTIPDHRRLRALVSQGVHAAARRGAAWARRAICRGAARRHVAQGGGPDPRLRPAPAGDHHRRDARYAGGRPRQVPSLVQQDRLGLLGRHVGGAAGGRSVPPLPPQDVRAAGATSPRTIS